MVFIVELAVGIAACLFKADLDELLQKSLKQSIKRSNSEDLSAWDNVQRNLMCCGVTGPGDWVEFGGSKVIRSSCCKPNDNNIAGDCSKLPAFSIDKYYQVQLRYRYVF